MKLVQAVRWSWVALIPFRFVSSKGFRTMYTDVTDSSIGWDNTGTTSITSATPKPIQSLNPGQYFVPPGTYKVSANATVPPGVFFVFQAGATLKPTTGITVTLDTAPEASPTQIFDLSAGGTVRIAKANEVWMEWFGSTADGAALQAAIDVMIATGGGIVRMPIGDIPISSTVTMQDARSVELIGSGFGHATGDTGTVLKWTGSQNQGPILDLAGVSQCTFRCFAVDGNSKAASIGLCLVTGTGSPPSVVSQKNTFDQVNFVGCQTGVEIGSAGQNQGNNDQCLWINCWFRDNNVGFSLRGDQHVKHHLLDCQLINHNNSGEGAAIRTAGGCTAVGSGTGSPDGGGVFVTNPTFGFNDCDLDLPRITEPLFVTGARSEGSLSCLRATGTSGSAGRTAHIIGFWQNSAHEDATFSIDFSNGNSLLVVGSHFVEPVLIDNELAGTKPDRTFINVDAVITRGSTQPYYFNRIGTGETELGEMLYEEGTVVVHGASDSVQVNNNATTTLGAAADLTGLLLVRRIATNRAGLFMVSGGAVFEVSDPDNVFSVSKDTASSINVYVESSNVILQNKSGSGHQFRFALVGGDAT